MNDGRAQQRQITRLALDAAGADAGFALAGSGAIREHGLIDRPTEDIDLFTVQAELPAFPAAVDRVLTALREVGYTVETRRHTDTFAQLNVTDAEGHTLGIDMGVDWREHPPVGLEVGPVLDINDAVGNKIAALFSRAETRDYLDVDAIRRTGRYTDTELLELARNADPGFDPPSFAQCLDRVDRIQPEEVRVYRVSAEDLDAVKRRLTSWARGLRRDTMRS